MTQLPHLKIDIHRPEARGIPPLLAPTEMSPNSKQTYLTRNKARKNKYPRQDDFDDDTVVFNRIEPEEPEEPEPHIDTQSAIMYHEELLSKCTDVRTLSMISDEYGFMSLIRVPFICNSETHRQLSSTSFFTDLKEEYLCGLSIECFQEELEKHPGFYLCAHKVSEGYYIPRIECVSV